MLDERRRVLRCVRTPRKLSMIYARHNNVLVRDILKNSQRVDEVLWNGSRDAPRVQRIGSIAIGLLLILCGVSSALTATGQHYLFEIVLTFAFVGTGLRIALNGLRRSRVIKLGAAPPEKSTFTEISE
jgi:hypothetical protein